MRPLFKKEAERPFGSTRAPRPPPEFIFFTSTVMCGAVNVATGKQKSRIRHGEAPEGLVETWMRLSI